MALRKEENVAGAEGEGVCSILCEPKRQNAGKKRRRNGKAFCCRKYYNCVVHSCSKRAREKEFSAFQSATDATSIRLHSAS